MRVILGYQSITGRRSADHVYDISGPPLSIEDPLPLRGSTSPASLLRGEI
jgi:hypothetical protein